MHEILFNRKNNCNAMHYMLILIKIPVNLAFLLTNEEILGTVFQYRATIFGNIYNNKQYI